MKIIISIIPGDPVCVEIEIKKMKRVVDVILQYYHYGMLGKLLPLIKSEPLCSRNYSLDIIPKILLGKYIIRNAKGDCVSLETLVKDVGGRLFFTKKVKGY